MNEEERDNLIDSLVEDLGRLSAIYKNSMISVCHALQIDDPALGSALSLARIKALIFLSKHGASPVGEVAQGMGVSIATASQILDRMVDDGWAARETNPADRRQVLVWLRPQATELANQLRQAHRRQVETALAETPPKERAIAVRAIRALTDALQATTEPGFVDDLIAGLVDSKPSGPEQYEGPNV